MFNLKIPKSQKPENLPLYFHTPGETNYLSWKEDYRQLVIIDIGYQNLCLRVEKRSSYISVIAFEGIGIGPDYTFGDIEEFLNQWKKEYFQSHVFIIEWQLPQNYKAVRISTFILSYFYFLVKESSLSPLLLEMRSGFKDKYFPILKQLNQNARKAKCVELALELLEKMNDTDSIKKIKSKKKKDDYADTVLMSEVFCRYASEKGWIFLYF